MTNNNKLIQLGDHYVSDFVPLDFDYAGLKKYPLDLEYSEKLKCPVLTEQPPSEMMWGKYWYRSSVNPMMQKALKNIVDDIEEHFVINEGDIWLDIASNDGTMLSYVKSGTIKVGIDPSEGDIHEECKTKANHVVCDYFSANAYNSIGLDKKAKVITCIAMFYDLPDPDSFISDAVSVMEDDGIMVIQLSYTPLMLEQLAFDNIVSEHFAYHSLSSVESICSRHGLKVVDVQTNDVNGGSIRMYFRKESAPSEGDIHEECKTKANHVVCDYFSANAYNSIGLDKKAKVITCIAMFYDLPDPDSFISDAVSVMEDDGIMVIQLSYTPLMLEQLAFDNIVSEHFAYHSLSSVESICSRHGLKVVDVQTNDVNGGSIRMYFRKESAPDTGWATQPYRDVCKLRYESLKQWEDNNYHPVNDWIDFGNRLEDLKNTLVNFIQHQKSMGKSIWAYGASTKGNTLLQYFGLNNSMIDGIAERSPAKYGLMTIGTNIPIYSEEDMRSKNPDFLLVLPWHFIYEFSIREKDYLENGGTFIVPCPKFQLLDKKGYR